MFCNKDWLPFFRYAGASSNHRDDEMTAIPKILEVDKTYRFLFPSTTVRASVKAVDAEAGWIRVFVEGVGDYWMNLATVSGVQSEAAAQAAEAERAKKADKKG